MSSGKPLDIGRFSGSQALVYENKGIEGFFPLDSGFRRNDEGEGATSLHFLYPFDRLKDLPIPKFVEPAMC